MKHYGYVIFLYTLIQPPMGHIKSGHVTVPVVKGSLKKKKEWLSFSSDQNKVTLITKWRGINIVTIRQSSTVQESV